MNEGAGENRIGFTIENYGRQSVFASFLPGIGGRKGIPIWCYYVNRGQCIVSFGLEDKAHSIMEFYPAHQAYQTVKVTGFRTFLRVNDQYAEPFADVELPHGMRIERNGLKIWEHNESLGVRTDVSYYNLPGEIVGGLIRKVTFRNVSAGSMELELLDGMPAVVPYGLAMRPLKEMGQTAKAWMQVENVEANIPVFKVRASTEDGAAITSVKGGNFSLAIDETGNLLRPVVDPDAVFAYDTSMQIAKQFGIHGLSGVYGYRQVMSNQYPCSFYGVARRVPSGGSVTIYQLIGQVRSKKELGKFLEQKLSPQWFEQKETEAAQLMQDICKVIDLRTADPDFDEYCRCTYMDNVLRGGFPIQLPGNKIFYIYSRKHGDLERDYNYFRMLPEFYSQGNGNFRDVNQNRRMDNFFTPYVGRENIRKFFGLLQMDGYNPLAVEQVTYTLTEEDVEEIFDPLSQEQKEDLMSDLTEGFTPGGFYKKLQELEIWDGRIQDDYFVKAMERSQEIVNARFAEGYWCDHWTYNLDLVESYLSIYPDRERELLLEQEYTYYACQIPVLPRIKRYVRAENGIRQYHFWDESMRRDDGETLVRSRFGLGEPVKVSLLEKLLVICATKYADLDAYAMGVEMAGGKPGWYDALNGLPGLFGSSMNETYELARVLEYVAEVLKRYPGQAVITREVAEYLRTMDDITMLYKNTIVRDKELLEFWNERNDAKEAYNLRTFHGISGEKVSVETTQLLEMVDNLLDTVKCGIRKALAFTDGVVPAYFTYELEDYVETREGIVPEHFALRKVPDFLEAPVHMLRLKDTAENKRKLYQTVKNSELYDRELKMYKVNTSLEKESYELGRARAFTPGWLENESVWMHMEYKYLLELLKSGLYKEYLEDFVNAAIPFQPPSRYGRSIYENSSFIASSRNPNKSYHGKGFVARLSGSTVEFLQMWKIMMFGKDTFRTENGKLLVSFQPTLPARLVGDACRVEAAFMGSTKVIYHFAEKKDYVPGEYRITEICVRYLEGGEFRTTSSVIDNLLAYDIRDGKTETIEVWIE
ncbi:MAG: hypothetical protein K6G30_07500 [Acetatifactor sp.]|nr:hypothetical protein [Acetatifactor sp.]